MMKPFLMLAAAVCGMGLIAGTDIPVNGKFAGSAVGDKTPKGWIFNTSVKPVGAGSVVQCGDELGVKIVAPKGDVHYYNEKRIPVKPGDVFEVKAEAVGKGRAGVGIYLYDARSNWITGKFPTTVLTPGKNKLTQTFTVPEEYNGKVPTTAWFSFQTIGEAEVTFTDFEIEKK